MRKRINIVLPETTIEAIDRMASHGQRSEFINEAVKHFVSHHSQEAMRTQLEAAVIRDRDLDREIAADWFSVDAEAWRRLDIQEEKKRIIPNVAKFTSRRSTRQ
jgi:metal-responsive CopG/Arc/MetJ family transcriptional regulator